MKKVFAIFLSLFLLASSAFAYTQLTRIRNFVNDKNNGIPITSSYMDAEFNQILTALNLTGIIQSTAPSSPINGSLWFDSTNKQLKVFRNNEWIVQGVVNVGASLPITAQAGDLYVNWSSSANLQEYNGSNWSNLLFPGSSSINWQDVNKNATINNGGINWNDVNKFHPVNLTGINWISIPNESSLKALFSTGNNSVNWQSIPAQNYSSFTSTSPVLDHIEAYTTAITNTTGIFFRTAPFPRSGSIQITFGAIGLGGSASGTAFIRKNSTQIGTTRSITSVNTTWSEVYPVSIGDYFDVNLSVCSNNCAITSFMVQSTNPNETYLVSSDGTTMATPMIKFGNGAPGTGVAVNCNVGDLYLRQDGSTSTTLNVCTASNTWTAK